MLDEQQHENSPETAEDAVEAPEPNDTPEEPGDEQDGTEDDTPALAKVRKEAAGHRAKLREVEAERDAVMAQRDALAATVLADALHGTGITAEAFTAAGHEVGSFLTERGELDGAALRTAARDVSKRFGVRAGRSPHTGTGPERPPETGKTWADAIQR